MSTDLIPEDPLFEKEGHTEILFVWREFLKKHPEAKRFETRLKPPPWTELYAQPFIYIPNEEIEATHAGWAKQLEEFLARPAQ